jgi:site-specific recombinase XerD
MNSLREFQRTANTSACDPSLASYIAILNRYLTQRGYSARSIGSERFCVSHFVYWMRRQRIRITQINQTLIARFLNRHLPRCDCAGVVRQLSSTKARAALGHLLAALRGDGRGREPARAFTAVDKELRLFDEHMDRVRGLSPKTRKQYLRTVGRLLRQQFAHRRVSVAAIKPQALRKFIAQQSKLYATPASAGCIAASLRGYFRYRRSCGDRVHHLYGVLNSPANWRLASLPKALSASEVARLLDSLGGSYRSARRSDAIVRCALDLGLRVGEIAHLGLDDIDWRAGTLTLRATKSLREQVLPLPPSTGRAIAQYLKSERPQTDDRTVFVRHIAPRDQPITSDCVSKVISRAYARAKLPYTRAHLLRHTMASRLLVGGSSLKEVADVLRHRCLDTTLIYAKLDSRNLAAVALPWPGSDS